MAERVHDRAGRGQHAELARVCEREPDARSAGARSTARGVGEELGDVGPGDQAMAVEAQAPAKQRSSGRRGPEPYRAEQVRVRSQPEHRQLQRPRPVQQREQGCRCGSVKGRWARLSSRADT